MLSVAAWLHTKLMRELAQNLTMVLDITKTLFTPHSWWQVDNCGWVRRFVFYIFHFSNSNAFAGIEEQLECVSKAIVPKK